MSSTKILSNSALVLSGEVLDRILRLLLVLVAPRLLGVAAYGKFQFAITYANLFLILADFGVHQLLVRDIARDINRTRELVANGFTLKLILSSCTIGLIYVVAQFTGKPAKDLDAVYILGWAMIAGSFSEYFAAVFRAHQKMLHDVIATLIFGVVVNIVGLYVLFAGMDFVMFCTAYLVAQIVRMLYCIIILKVKFTPLSLGLDFSTIKFLAREGFTFGILYFFALLYTNIDSQMLSYMTTDETVGWYALAYRLINAIMFIPVALMKVVFPAMSQYYGESFERFQALFERSFKVMFLIGFGIAAIISGLADQIVSIFGDEFRPAAGALRILVWATAIIFIGTVQTHATRASHHEKFTAKVVASSAILNVILNFILIPHFSLYGAAFATIVSELFTFVFHSIYLSKKLVAPPILKLAPKIMIIAGMTILYVVAIHGVSLFLVLPTSGLLVFVLMFATRYFTSEEISFIKDLVKSRGKVAIS